MGHSRSELAGIEARSYAFHANSKIVGNLMNPDIYAKIRLRTSSEGGRKTALRRKTLIGGDFYSCPIIIDGEAFECRLLVGNEILELGKYYQVPIWFLNRESVLPRLSIRKTITLWEGRDIGDGEITQIG